MSPGSGNATTAATELPPLQNIDENWEKALAVVAHPDDLEYSAAAAIARWTRQGKTITYCMATSGEAGIDDMMPEDAGPLREREQRAAAKVVGVSDVRFLAYPDGVVEYGLPLRRDIARAIRQARPTIVITGNFHDADAIGTPNQADHIATGRAVIDAIRDAGNRWLFPELLDEGLEPWGGVRAVFVAGSPIAGHGVDVTDTLALGIASLKAHSQYLAGLGDGAAERTEVMLTMMARRTGGRLGVSHATDFRSSRSARQASRPTTASAPRSRRQPWPAIGRLGPESKNPKRDVVAFAPVRINHRTLRRVASRSRLRDWASSRGSLGRVRPRRPERRAWPAVPERRVPLALRRKHLATTRSW